MLPTVRGPALTVLLPFCVSAFHRGPAPHVMNTMTASLGHAVTEPPVWTSLLGQRQVALSAPVSLAGLAALAKWRSRMHALGDDIRVLE